jgi:hypothetical protein
MGGGLFRSDEIVYTGQGVRSEDRQVSSNSCGGCGERAGEWKKRGVESGGEGGGGRGRDGEGEKERK